MAKGSGAAPLLLPRSGAIHIEHGDAILTSPSNLHCKHLLEDSHERRTAQQYCSRRHLWNSVEPVTI
ncbi:TPA: hypothetical protein ACH3X2_008537 [Trebouxia sp. C0005]